MSYDNLCKYLAQKYPERFASWVLGKKISSPVEVLKTELTLEPIRADSVIFLRTTTSILHLEFQVKVPKDKEKAMPLRMLDYWLRLYWQYGVPVKQVLIWLKETDNPAVFETEFKSGSTQHKYKVLRLWEQDPQTFLQDPALLPLAVLCKTKDKSQLLSQVAGIVASIEDTAQRREIAACTQVLAGLRFNKNLLKNFFREEIMQESVIYQDILQKGVAKGLEQGFELGKQQGELAMIMKMLNRRLGTLDALDADIIERIESLTTPELEQLSLAFWDFSQVTDLVAWLESR